MDFGRTRDRYPVSSQWAIITCARGLVINLVVDRIVVVSVKVNILSVGLMVDIMKDNVRKAHHE